MDPTSQYHYPLDSSTGRWTLLATILASSMAFIDGTALNVILPSLQTHLHANATDLFWVLNSYLLMLSALIILGGSLGDKLGRVKVFKLGIFIFMIGSALCGFTPNITMLIVFRTIQGIGGAFMIPGSLAIISAVFNQQEKGKAIGTWSAATTIVTICGPVIGGALADMGLWRSIFFINIPLALISIIILHFKVPESHASETAKIDWWGATVLTLSLILFTSGLLEVPELGYKHWLVISSILSGIILFFVFIFIEKSARHPMIPLSIFENKTFSGVNLLSFFLYGALGGIMLFLSLNMIQIQGYSQLQAGLTFLPFSITMILLARIMGKMTDKYGARRLLIIGPLVTAVGILWLSLIGITSGPESYWTTYFPGFLIFALGMSMTVVPLTTAVMTSAPEDKSGIASGINNSVTRISGTFMNAILGAAAIYFFSYVVKNKVSLLTISDTIESEIIHEAINFGEARASSSYELALQGQINIIFKNSFIITYRWIGILCAVIAFLSSFFAFFMMKTTSTKKRDADTI